MTDAMAPAQQFLRQRYRVIRQVGRGGQGRVFLAEDSVHGRPVAVKTRPAPGGVAPPEALAEARALLSTPPHPSLPVVREDFVEGEQYHVVMDWISGEPLSSLLRAKPSGLPITDVVKWLGQVASALDVLHACEPPIVHGDVKPSNILVTGGGAVLVDFGVATTAAGPSTGWSRGFLAPEASATPGRPSQDVYALAATAVALLTGAPPVLGRRPTLRSVPPAERGHVERVLGEALAADPHRRPQRATSLVGALSRAGPLEVGNNLPAPVDRFFGRDAELRILGRLLDRGRLVTLTGPGGIGKTRLALETARHAGHGFSGGVWFVDAAPLDSDLCGATAAAVGAAAGADPLGYLRSHVGDRPSLFVIDNVEHRLDEAIAALAGILHTVPAARVIVTSRIALRMPGERAMAVGPLNAAARQGRRSDAERLLWDRIARRPLPGEREAGRDLVRHLDGVPLAIELIAGRVGNRHVGDVAASLATHLPVAKRRGLDRQRTVARSIDWSLELLEPGARRAFPRLCAFAGSFDHAAAVAMGVSAEDLDALVSAALVLDVGRGGRYRLLEPVRQRGAALLAASGEDRAIADLHAAWFGEQSDRVRSHAQPPVASSERNAADSENFARAAAHLAGNGCAEAAVALVTNIFPGAIGAGSTRWVSAFLTEQLERPLSLAPEVLASAELAVATASEMAGRADDAYRWARSAEARLRRAGRPALLARACLRLGYIAMGRGRTADAFAWHQEGFYLARGDVATKARCLGSMGSILLGWDRPDDAEPLLDAALELYEAAGAPESLAMGLVERSLLHVARREPARAVEMLDRAVDLARRHERQSLLALALLHRGRQSTNALAARDLAEALAIWTEHGDEQGCFWALRALVHHAVRQQRYERAAVHLARLVQVLPDDPPPLWSVDLALACGTTAVHTGRPRWGAMVLAAALGREDVRTRSTAVVDRAAEAFELARSRLGFDGRVERATRGADDASLATYVRAWPPQAEAPLPALPRRPTP